MLLVDGNNPMVSSYLLGKFNTFRICSNSAFSEASTCAVSSPHTCLAPGEAGSGGGGGHAPQDMLLVVFSACSSAPAFCRRVRVLGGIQNLSESFGHKLSSLFR